ncbi:MAG TPA: FxsA family protein [Acidimicrobiia bacterium]|nr:FxsA family protein [Acidimicrobiia bacterium]
MFVVILLLVLWPVVEIAVFLQVVAWIGALNTVALMVAISLCGAWLVKRQGVGTLARMRAELDDGRIPTGPMTDGGLLAAAGFLLLVPGFVTDVFGLALLVPPVRGGVRRGLGRRFTARTARLRRAPGYLDVEGTQSNPQSPDRWDPPELSP